MAKKPYSRHSPLLSLPQEIKDQIWAYAFANTEVRLYRNRLFERTALYNDFTCCDPCARFDSTPTGPTDKCNEDYVKRRHSGRYKLTPQNRYNELIRPMFACKTMLKECLALFQSTMELQLKSSEAIPWIRRSAPDHLTERVTRISLAIHFDGANHFLWLVRILELQDTFPNLKRLHLKYHMRPPVSYDNMLDAMYVSMAVLGLREPFSEPVYVLDENAEAPEVETGTTIETAYQESQYLFSADFLGEVSTDDAIGEHTKVIRRLFNDTGYRSAVSLLLNSNQPYLREYVSSKHGPYGFPTHLQRSGLPNEAYMHLAQHTLLAIARSHEKPWFESLMRRRMVSVWIENYGEGRRAEVEGFMATIPEGEGIERLIEAVIERPGLANLFGVEVDDEDSNDDQPVHL